MPRIMENSDVADATCLRPISHVARFLSLSRSKIYAMMDAGQLPYVKLGKSRRVRWSDVLRLVEQSTVNRQSTE